jgi:hypothetical protein
VRLLVVHHTLIPGNGYEQDQVAQLLRDIYTFHTGAEKRWPDIAYNFMVDQFGGIWETREGSLDGPVRGSATGGNQGFSQLCCFLGDLSDQPPTAEAATAMAWLLAQLADRYDIDTSPGSQVSLESRGSSRFAAGAPMTLPTLAGHRDVSLTACPGDTGYSFLQQTLPGLVNLRREQTATTTTTEPTTTTVAPSTATSSPTTAVDNVDNSTATSAQQSDASDETAAADSGGGTDEESIIPWLIGAGALAGAGAAVVAVAKRKANDSEEDIHATADAGERHDGTISVPTRLGLPVDEPADVVPVPDTNRAQRVWWAVAADASPSTQAAVEDLTRDIHFHAVQAPEDPELDRLEWSRLDSLLAKRAHQTTAAVVAARSNSVFVLRSEPCLVVVTRPDGIEKRDAGRDALSVARGDVARIAVHFDGEGSYPDIEVTAN